MLTTNGKICCSFSITKKFSFIAYIHGTIHKIKRFSEIICFNSYQKKIKIKKNNKENRHTDISGFFFQYVNILTERLMPVLSLLTNHNFYLQ